MFVLFYKILCCVLHLLFCSHCFSDCLHWLECWPADLKGLVAFGGNNLLITEIPLLYHNIYHIKFCLKCGFTVSFFEE